MTFLIKIIDNVFKVVVVICAMAMTAVVLAGVFSRYVLVASLPWTEELPRFLMIWMAMFAGPVAFDYHVSFSALYDKAGKRLKLTIYVLTRLMIMAFLFILSYEGFILMKTFAFQSAPTLQISYAIPYASVPIAGALFLLKYVMEFLAVMKKGIKESGDGEVVKSV
jgi:TRAP-type C4-dicarboxylate transport system permease small subunit